MTGSVGKYHLTAWQCHCWCLRCVLMCLKVLNAARLNCTQLICRFCLKNWNEIKLNEKTTHDLLSHTILNLWVLWGPLHDVSVLSSIGTTNKGQIRSSLAAALRVHPHLLPRQSLLIHTGKICILLQPKPNTGGTSRDFCTPFWFALTLWSFVCFVFLLCYRISHSYLGLLLGAPASFEETI